MNLSRLAGYKRQIFEEEPEQFYYRQEEIIGSKTKDFNIKISVKELNIKKTRREGYRVLNSVHKIFLTWKFEG